MQRYESPNDYAMLLSTYLEASNQRVMLNKHRMKIAVINVGFAVICIGLLLLVLGVDAGGIEVSGSAKDVATVNLKVASSGVAVFVLGAGMSAAGGLLPNEYRTVSLPGFASKYNADVPKTSAATQQAKLAELFTVCERDTATPVDRQSCYQNAVAMVVR
jgi:hypothetical protein